MTAPPLTPTTGIPAAEAALRLLDSDTDPTSIAAGQPDSHRHTALLVHLAAQATHHAEVAERRAGFSPETLLDLHLDADTAATDPGPTGPDRSLLWLQIVRVRRARYTIHALRGESQHPIADACLASLDAVTDLLGAWDDATPHQPTPGGPATGERVKIAPILEALRRLDYAHHVLEVTTSHAARYTGQAR